MSTTVIATTLCSAGHRNELRPVEVLADGSCLYGPAYNTCVTCGQPNFAGSASFHPVRTAPFVEVRVPRRFYEDHLERECGSTGEVVRWLDRQVVVSLDEAAYDDLLSDADYYSLADGLDPELMGLVRSARATKAALLKAGIVF